MNKLTKQILTVAGCCIAIELADEAARTLLIMRPLGYVFDVITLIIFGVGVWGAFYLSAKSWRGDPLAGAIMCAGMGFVGFIIGQALWG
jgi:hypothetical protein